MKDDLEKNLGQIEITDLIVDSVANATQRRQQVIVDSLVDIPEEEAKNIQGGESSIPIPIPFDPNDPCIVGLCIPPEKPPLSLF